MASENDSVIKDLKDRVKALEDFIHEKEVAEQLDGVQWATGELCERVIKLETACELFGCLLTDIVSGVPVVIRQVMVGMTRRFLPDFPSNDGLAVDLRSVLRRLTPKPLM